MTNIYIAKLSNGITIGGNVNSIRRVVGGRRLNIDTKAPISSPEGQKLYVKAQTNKTFNK